MPTIRQDDLIQSIADAFQFISYYHPRDFIQAMGRAYELIGGRRSLAGSMIGGIRETQEMLNFCAEKGIASDIEVISMDYINTAYERMLKSDIRYRFVIDLASLKA